MLDIENFVEGLEVTFTFIGGKRFNGKSLPSFLIEILKKHDVSGYTMRAAMEGVDHEKKKHSTTFFELADNPIELCFVDKPVIVKTVLDEIKELKPPVFCVVKEATFLNFTDYPQ